MLQLKQDKLFRKRYMGMEEGCVGLQLHGGDEEKEDCFGEYDVLRDQTYIKAIIKAIAAASVEALGAWGLLK